MRNLFLIAKIMFRNSGNIFSSLMARRKRGKRDTVDTPSKRLGLMILIGIVFVAFFISMYTTGFGLFSMGAAAGVLDEMLKIALPVFMLMLAMLTLTLVITYFFLSTDTEVFLPLPIKPEEIFFGRLIVSSLNAFLIELAFFVPIIASYDVIVQPSLLIYLNQVIFLLVLPFIPLSVTFLFSLLLARIFNIAKHRDTFTLFLYILSISLVVVMELGLSAIPTDTGTGDYLLQIADTIRSAAVRWQFFDFLMRFPFYGFTDGSFMGFLNMLFFAFLSLLTIALAILFSKGFYMKALVGGDDRKAHRRKINVSKELSSEAKHSSTLFAMIRNEWRGIVRSPIYAFNLLMPPVLMIVILAGSSVVSLSAAGVDGTSALAEIATFLQGAFSANSGASLFFVATGVFFVSGITMISATGISREGKNAFLLKTWPIKPLTQLRAKIAIGTAVTACVMLLFFAVMTVFFRLNPLYVFLAFIPSVFLLMAGNYITLLIDLAKPFLDWENETMAVKQNTNGIWGMLINWGVASVFAGFGVLFAFFPIHMIWAFIIVTLLSIGLVYLIEQRIVKKGSAIFKGIQ